MPTMSETLENTGNHVRTSGDTDLHTETPPSKPGELNARQEAFCRRYAEGISAADAYTGAYCSSSRTVARAAAMRLVRNPKVQERVRELQDAAASPKPLRPCSLVLTLR
jgi:Terminase small subunit